MRSITKLTPDRAIITYTQTGTAQWINLAMCENYNNITNHRCCIVNPYRGISNNVTVYSQDILGCRTSLRRQQRWEDGWIEEVRTELRDIQ